MAAPALLEFTTAPAPVEIAGCVLFPVGARRDRAQPEYRNGVRRRSPAESTTSFRGLVLNRVVPKT